MRNWDPMDWGVFLIMLGTFGSLFVIAVGFAVSLALGTPFK